jgi:hypothetical protein
VKECVDILANKLYKGGKIKDKCESAGFYQRIILIEKQFKGASVLMHKLGYLPTGFQNLWSNERLLNVAEQLVGPNIAGNFKLCNTVHLPDPYTGFPSTQAIQCGIFVSSLLTMSRPQFPGTRIMHIWMNQPSTHTWRMHGSHSLMQPRKMDACR